MCQTISSDSVPIDLRLLLLSEPGGNEPLAGIRAGRTPHWPDSARGRCPNNLHASASHVMSWHYLLFFPSPALPRVVLIGYNVRLRYKPTYHICNSGDLRFCMYIAQRNIFNSYETRSSGTDHVGNPNTPQHSKVYKFESAGARKKSAT